MDIRNVIIDAYATVGSGLMLVETAPYYSYIDNKRSDEIMGYRYVVVMPQHNLDKLAIKIPGPLQCEKPEGHYPAVEFSGLHLKVFWSPEGYKVAAEADGIIT